MSSFSGQDPLNPDDPGFYAPPPSRGRATSSLSQEARSEPVRSSTISPPASLDIQLKNQDNDALWNPLDPEVINERARLARDRRTTQLAVAAAGAGVVAVVALLFVIMKPAPPQSVAAGSTPSDTTGSTSTAPPQPSQGDVEPKPALAEFKALLASPPSQPATHEESQQLLQQFLQWRKKADTTETSQ